MNISWYSHTIPGYCIHTNTAMRNMTLYQDFPPLLNRQNCFCERIRCYLREGIFYGRRSADDDFCHFTPPKENPPENLRGVLFCLPLFITAQPTHTSVRRLLPCISRYRCRSLTAQPPPSTFLPVLPMMPPHLPLFPRATLIPLPLTPVRMQLPHSRQSSG